MAAVSGRLGHGPSLGRWQLGRRLGRRLEQRLGQMNVNKDNADVCLCELALFQAARKTKQAGKLGKPLFDPPPCNLLYITKR